MDSNAVIMKKYMKHTAAGSGGWFTATVHNANCALVGLRLDRVHATDEPHFVCSPTEITSSCRCRSSCLDPSSTAAFTPAQKNGTYRETAADSVLTGPNSTVVKIPRHLKR